MELPNIYKGRRAALLPLGLPTSIVFSLQIATNGLIWVFVAMGMIGSDCRCRHSFVSFLIIWIIRYYSKESKYGASSFLS